MAKKKPVTKKPVSKTAAKKAANAKKKSSAPSAPKRPGGAPDIPLTFLSDIEESLKSTRDDLQDFAAHLRALDRKRLNHIGNKREGFAQRAYRLAMENPEYLPNYLSKNRYTEDYKYYIALQGVVVMEAQVHELLKNINVECMDYFYTDGLDFYASVREAAKRRVDAAESLYEELKSSFERMGKRGEEEPTEKELLRDAKSVARGKKDGRIVIENESPKMTGGKHTVIDETFKEDAKFRETGEGEIKE
jgi:hypothetical protein